MKLTINGREVSCPGGVTYLSLLKELGLEKGALGVSHRGATLSLNAQAEGGAEVRVLTLQDEEGRRIYERTLQFLLLAAARRALGPETRVRIEHSLGDGLYAYVLLWDRKGWMDYIVPQLYWNLDTKAAPSRKLVKWWNDNIHNSDLYIGQDVQRTMNMADPGNNDRNELDTKVRLTRQLPNVKGNVWWHGYWVTGNYKGAADSLASKYQSTIALPPVYDGPGHGPKGINDLKIVKSHEGKFLEWNRPEQGREPKSDDVVKFVVYEFFPGEKQDIEDPQAIVAMTPYNRVRVENAERGMTYAVTTMDRLNRESSPVFLYVK